MRPSAGAGRSCGACWRCPVPSQPSVPRSVAPRAPSGIQWPEPAMAYFLLYQALPLALLWIVLERACRSPARARWALALILVAGGAAQFALFAGSSPDLENPDS